MTTSSTATATNPRHVFIGITDLMARWRKGRSCTYDRVATPGFPRPVVQGRWRLDHVMVWEDRRAAGEFMSSQTHRETERLEESAEVDEAAAVGNPLVRKSVGRPKRAV